MNMNKYWPQTYIDSVGLNTVRSQDYLVIVLSTGEIACKACGRFLPYENPTKHFNRHMAELDRFLAGKQKEQREETADGYYPNPCESCGNVIPRSGKPGRPPTLCDSCRFPMVNYTEEEKELIEELLG